MKSIIILSLLALATAKSISKPTNKYPKKYDPKIHGISSKQDPPSSYLDYEPVKNSDFHLSPLRVGLMVPYEKSSYLDYLPVPMDHLVPPPIKSSYSSYVTPKKTKFSIPGYVEPTTPKPRTILLKVPSQETQDKSTYSTYLSESTHIESMSPPSL